MALMAKNPPANAGDTRDGGLIPGSERSLEKAWQRTPVSLPGESHRKRAWWAIVHRIAKSLTRLKQFSIHWDKGYLAYFK